MTDFYEEACYLSTSEAEPDSDFEDDSHSAGRVSSSSAAATPAQLNWDDPQELLNTWLGELDSIHVGVDSATAGGGPRPLSVPDVERLQMHEPRIDSYRFSMANLEDSQDGELDAILKELCALGSQFDQELKEDNNQRNLNQGVDPLRPASGVRMFPSRRSHSRSNSGGGVKMRLDLGNINTLAANFGDNIDPAHRTDSGLRTESPDNDSAFSDNISMLSSESSASSGASAARTDASKSSGTGSSTGGQVPDAAARLKAEKIRLALEKMKEANVKKLFIKAFTSDGSTKSLLVDEKMTVGHVIRLLADKNHVRMEPKWSLVEHLPHLYMERIYEDHEMLVDQLMLWTRDSKNTLLFVERPDKYALFSRPEDYLLVGSSSERDRHLDDEARLNLLDEFFSPAGVGVPEIEGPLYLKAEGKKAWKKYYFVLRASGLYYSPKGKSKSSKDLICLATFDVNQVYCSVNWRKKYKAPTDFGFAIKHPKLQSKSAKFIKYLCADDERTWAQWIMGIRIAKYGRSLSDNYKALLEDLAQEDLDQLANARSFSLASVTHNPARSHPVPEADDDIDESQENLTPMNTLTRRDPLSCNGSQLEPVRCLSRQDSIKSRTSTSSSSGCLSERSSTGPSTPTFEHAFDSDFPMGTIKRKPSMTPKLPLTSTTRLLVKEVEDKVDGELTESANISRNSHRQSIRKSLTDEVNTIRRKNSIISCGSELDIDSLPLPPPPPEFIAEDAGEFLPPPPPEAFENLPPPPPEEEEAPSLKHSTEALKPCLKTAPRTPPKPPAGSLARREVLTVENIYANSHPAADGTAKKNRRITFDDVPEILPRRADFSRSSMKQTIPQRLNSPGCTVTPPKEFLKDLQRVMQKKWQVAQKCKANVDMTPHEVLGFRDVPPAAVVPSSYKENSVRAWVAEHYGAESTAEVGGFYENVFVPSGTPAAGADVYDSCVVDLRREYPHPYLPAQPTQHQQQRKGPPSVTSTSSGGGGGGGGTSVAAGKRPPPPPPKRSETTHLTTRIH